MCLLPVVGSRRSSPGFRIILPSRAVVYSWGFIVSSIPHAPFDERYSPTSVGGMTIMEKDCVCPLQKPSVDEVVLNPSSRSTTSRLVANNPSNREATHIYFDLKDATTLVAFQDICYPPAVMLVLSPRFHHASSTHVHLYVFHISIGYKFDLIIGRTNNKSTLTGSLASLETSRRGTKATRSCPGQLTTPSLPLPRIGH
jgi:hypothetical protein